MKTSQFKYSSRVHQIYSAKRPWDQRRTTCLPGSPQPKCHHNTPRSYAALWLPSNDSGGFTDRMGAKGKRGILTKMSPETTTSLQADGTTK